MKVLVDFLPLLPRGGGLQNARNLWLAVDRLGGEHEWIAVARPDLGLAPRVGAHHEVRHMAPATLAARLRAENVELPRLAREWGADVMWTPMGAGPLRSPVPRVLGWHDSTVAYPGSPVHARMGWRERMVEGLRARMGAMAARGATAITVQTATMRARLADVWRVPAERFHIVPNGPSSLLAGEPPAPDTAPPGSGVILVVAEAKPAKNLEVVPAVAAELARRGRSDLSFVLTLPEGDGPWMGPFNRAVAESGPSVPMRRIGRVPHEALGDLYRSASAVLLPSHFESFSATYLEAMHFGVPLVTSDRDFARDLCGDAALFADPEDPVALADALERAIDDGATRSRLRHAGFSRVRTFPDWDRRFALYLEVLEGAVAGTGARSARAFPAGPAREVRT